MPREALNAIDAELEALEKRLAELPSESASASESASSSSSSKEKKRKKKHKKEDKKDAKKRRRKRREASSDDDVDVIVGGDDLPRIEPLPAALLPEGNDYKGKGARGSFLGKSSVGARGAPIPAGSRADRRGQWTRRGRLKTSSSGAWRNARIDRGARCARWTLRATRSTPSTRAGRSI